MPRASKVTNPSCELMDGHEGRSLIYRQHGFPSPLVHQHFHKEHELHPIVASSGKVFTGDYIGSFIPGTLFLTDPNLSHNWISQVEPDEVMARHDMLVSFADEVLGDDNDVFSELNRLAPLLARARYGIEFRDLALIDESRRLLQRIADSDGMTRLGYFFILMEQLAECGDYQSPSTVTSSQLADGHNVERVNRAVDCIFQHYAQDLTQEQAAAHLSMTPTCFSRFFKQATGRGFVEFVNRLRIGKSCELLARSGLPATEMCFESDFSNLSSFDWHFQQLKGMTPTDYRHLATQRLTEQNLLRAFNAPPRRCKKVSVEVQSRLCRLCDAPV